MCLPAFAIICEDQRMDVAIVAVHFAFRVPFERACAYMRVINEPPHSTRMRRRSV